MYVKVCVVIMNLCMFVFMADMADMVHYIISKIETSAPTTSDIRSASHCHIGLADIRTDIQSDLCRSLRTSKLILDRGDALYLMLPTISLF